jgi:hypothetical protein
MARKALEKKQFLFNWEISLWIGLLLYFSIRLVFYAFKINPNIPPDEVTHFGLSLLYSRYWLLPGNSPESYSFGLVTHQPYLYYYLMGNILKLNFFPVPDLVFLRLTNGILGVLTVIVAYKSMTFYLKQPVMRILFGVLITNTPMFSFLYGSVSYDNLTNLFASLSFYFMFSFFENRENHSLIYFLIFMLAGILTKMTFLPLFFILGVIFVFHERKNITNGLQPFKDFFKTIKLKEGFLIVILGVLFLLNSSLYLRNLVFYHQIVPNAEKILSEEQCMQYRIFARDRIVTAYKDDKISLEEAMNQTKLINHPGDRAGAISLIQNLVLVKLGKVQVLDRVQFFFLWSKLMLRSIFGILGHAYLFRSDALLSVYIVILLLGFILFVRHWNRGSENAYGSYLLLSALIYSLFLQLGNYPTYVDFGVAEYGLHGRYLFPVMIPFYGLLAYYLVHNQKQYFQTVILLFVSAFFIYGDFIYFCSHVTPDWYRG